jgi:heme/copper-type cytochrome/quinol oxidase subunit 2
MLQLINSTNFAFVLFSLLSAALPTEAYAVLETRKSKAKTSSVSKSKTKKKFPIGAIVAIVVVVVVLIVLALLVMFLIKKRKAKKSQKMAEGAPPQGQVEQPAYQQGYQQQQGYA